MGLPRVDCEGLAILADRVFDVLRFVALKPAFESVAQAHFRVSPGLGIGLARYDLKSQAVCPYGPFEVLAAIADGQLRQAMAEGKLQLRP